MLKLKGIKIKNHFKGLGPLEINGLNDVNIFIGRNNSGKSTLLEAINHLLLPSWTTGLPPQFWQHTSTVIRREPIILEGIFHVNPNINAQEFTPLKNICQQNKLDFATVCSLIGVQVTYTWGQANTAAKRQEVTIRPSTKIIDAKNKSEKDVLSYIESHPNDTIFSEIRHNILEAFYKMIQAGQLAHIITPSARTMDASVSCI